jgi:prevent-host-death family protein
MADVFPLTSARARLGELVNRARFGRERVVISEHGTPVAAIISVEELAELQAAADAADVAAATAILGRGEPGVPHAEFMAAMDALVTAEHAGRADQARDLLSPHADVLALADVDLRNILSE